MNKATATTIYEQMTLLFLDNLVKSHHNLSIEDLTTLAELEHKHPKAAIWKTIKQLDLYVKKQG